MNFSSTIQEGIRSLCHVQNIPLSTITYRTHTRHKSQTPSTRGSCFPIFGPNDSKKAVLPWVDSGYYANIQAVAALCVHHSWHEISLDRPWQFWVSTCLDTATTRFCVLARRKVEVISIQRGLDHMRPDNRITRAGPARQLRAVRLSGLFRETNLRGSSTSERGARRGCKFYAVGQSPGAGAVASGAVACPAIDFSKLPMRSRTNPVAAHTRTDVMTCRSRSTPATASFR